MTDNQCQPVSGAGSNASREELLYLADQERHIRGMLHPDDHGELRASAVKEYALRSVAQCGVQSASDPLKLGDAVQFNALAPYASEWRGVELKVVSLRMSPDGALWVSVIEPEDNMAHRGHGVYDGETTDIPAEHLSLLSSAHRGGEAS